jgi:aconitate decarboxylase
MNDAAATSNPYTRAMAQFVADLRYERIPAEAIDRAKLLILDSLGCAIFATGLEWSRILIDTLSLLDTSTACTVVGTGCRLSAPHAALVNGTLIHGFELDDVHRAGVLHVGAVTLPALLAIAESRPELSGRDLLAAAVAGYEVGPRAGMCMGQEHIAQGWHSGATVGVFAAAAGAAAALRLPVDKVVHAFGIAGTQSAGLMAAQYGSMVKRMHAGRSAQSGLYAALLAQAGFTGILDVFESPYGGFCTTFSRSTDRFHLEELVSGLGQRFETLRVSLKFYSCVGSNHTTLDAVRALQAKRRFGVDDIERIVVHGSRVTVDHVGWKYRPEGMTSAQLNLPYCVATLLIEGDVFVDQFTQEKLADAQRIRVADLVEVREDPSITARGSRYRHMVRVEVFLRDGSRLEEIIEAPRGSELKFASAPDVIEKFRKLAAHRIPRAHADRLLEQVMTIEHLASAAKLVQSLAVAP